MNVYRLKNWTHYEPVGKRFNQFGFKASPGSHGVFVLLGSIPANEPLTEEWLKSALEFLGLQPSLEAEIFTDSEIE